MRIPSYKIKPDFLYYEGEVKLDFLKFLKDLQMMWATMRCVYEVKEYREKNKMGATL